MNATDIAHTEVQAATYHHSIGSEPTALTETYFAQHLTKLEIC